MENEKSPRYIRGKYTEGQKESTRKYNEKAYDRIELKVTKGQKPILQEHAKSKGESLNSFVNRAINETMERDKQSNA